MNRLPLPSGFDFEEDVFELTGPPRKVVGESITDPGRRKPIPRTLVEAFPISEGRRHAFGRIREDGALEVDPSPRPRGLRAWVTPDRVCWLIVLGVAAFIVRWAWLAPKGLG
jgi:hypothetical protein